VKCRAYCKTSSESEEIPVEVYQRLHISYYSVDLRLLCFYTLQNYRDVDSIRELVPDSNLDSSVLKENEMNKQTAPTTFDKTTKEKFLHDITKKEGLVFTEPLPLKALRYWGFGYLLVVLALAVGYLLLHRNQGYIQDYLDITRTNGEVLGDTCQAAVLARLEQVALFFPANVPAYAEVDYNLNTSVTVLQTGQIKVDGIFLRYGSYDSLPTLEYTRGSNLVVTSTALNLNSHIFDFVTVGASMKSLPQSAFNFSLQIMSTTNVTSPVIILFKLRYNSLFQILPTEKTFIATFTALFDSLFATENTKATICLVAALLAVLIVFVVAIALGVSVVNNSDRTMLLFGHLSRQEVEREIVNCSSFLEIFYRDSYMIKLKNRQKNKDQYVGQFDIGEEVNLKKGQPVATTRSIKTCSFNYDSSPQASVSKIEFLEKELQLRTEAELVVGGESEADNEQQLLRGQGESSEDNDIYDRLEGQSDGCRGRLVVLYLLLMGFFMGYFGKDYATFRSYNDGILNDIHSLQLIFANLNSLRLLRLYALETYIDNSPFLTFSLLNDSLATIYSDLYRNQRDFNQLIFDHPSIPFPYSYRNICAPASIADLATTPNLKYYTPASFSSAECTTLLQGALNEGLRLGIVAYTESLLNLSKLNISVTNFSGANYL
jgi:hypothetical protein